jgi:hypothetical protein
MTWATDVAIAPIAAALRTLRQSTFLATTSTISSAGRLAGELARCRSGCSVRRVVIPNPPRRSSRALRNTSACRRAGVETGAMTTMDVCRCARAPRASLETSAFMVGRRQEQTRPQLWIPEQRCLGIRGMAWDLPQA